MIRFKNFTFIVLILFSFKLKAQHQNKEIKNYIVQVQKEYNIPGMALAVIRNGKVIHKQNCGLANIELSIPVSDKTLFPLFSTSKVFSVIAVYQLIQQKKLSLDNYISDFLNDLPDGWKAVQIKNLITHSSGLPDIVAHGNENEEDAKEKVYKDSIKFAPNKRFDYNQTNYWLLNRIFQKIVRKSLSTYILDTQFQSSLSSVVFEGNNMKLVDNLSYGYVYSQNNAQFSKRNWSFPEYLYGAAALNMTLNSFVEWNNRLDNNELISEKMQAQLFTHFNYEEKRDFTYGLDLIKNSGESSYGFSGGVSTAFRKFTEKNLTIILLANGQFIPTNKLNGINEVVNNISKLANNR